MEEADPSHLLWLPLVGREEEGVHGVLIAHVPDHDNLLAYEMLCETKGRVNFIQPFPRSPKCEGCERVYHTLEIIPPNPPAG